MSVNASARQTWDLIFKSDTDSPIGVMLDRSTPRDQRAHIGIRSGPSQEGEAPRLRDVPVVMDDFSRGALFSQRMPGYEYGTYAWGEGICARWPRIVIPAGKLTLEAFFPGPLASSIGGVTCHAELNGNVYFGTGNGFIIECTGLTGHPNVVAGYAPRSFAAATVFQGSAYFGSIADGAQNPAGMVRLTGSTFTDLAGTVNRGRLAVAYNVTADGVGAHRLWATSGPNTLRYVAGDPAVPGNWGPSIPVGDSTYPINALAASNRHVWAVARDGIHDVDELGYAPNLTPYWRQTIDVNNGNCVLVHQGHIYAGQGIYGLDRYNLSQNGVRQDIAQYSGPGVGQSNETPVNGDVTAICSEQNGWIAAAVRNTDNGRWYVMYGMDKLDAGINVPGHLIWHGAEAVSPPELTVPVYVNHMHVVAPTGANPKMWIWAQDDAGGIYGYTLSLPKAGSPLSDVLFGGTHKFNPEATLYMTAQDTGIEYGMNKKQVWEYDMRADNISGARNVELYANDAGGEYVFQGAMTSGPRATLGPSDVDGHTIGLKAVLHSNEDDAVHFRGVRMRQEVIAERTEYIPYEFEWGPLVRTREPGRFDDRRKAEQVEAQILAMQDDRPFEMINEDGQTLIVRLAQQVEVFKDEADAQYGVFRRRGRGLFRIMGRRARYDAGYLYDAGNTYA